MIINDFVREVLSLNCFGFVTSINPDKRNELTRIFGYYFDEASGIMTTLVYKEDAVKLQSCFNHSKKTACTITDPLCFKTLQFKGECLSFAEASEEEINLIKDKFRPRFREVLVAFGMPENLTDKWKYQPAMAIRIQCAEIFDQTPKINTGVKICQA